ncbi:MAG: hypothetical protein Q7K57_44625 [Burkholderiaceae bacterium]|nr:hypothetical protein [Burkholderiaceae bacterium]
MNIYLEITLWVELFLFVLLVLTCPLNLLESYWALMNVARVRDTPGQGMTRPAGIIAGYLLIRGYIFDFLCNMCWMTVLLRELPKELIVTDRLNRHAAGTDWRHDRCDWLQVQFCKWYDVKHPDGIHR